MRQTMPSFCFVCLIAGRAGSLARPEGNRYSSRRSVENYNTMWRSSSKFVVIGKVAEDPEVKYISGGFAVVRFRVIVSERLQNESGQWQERKGCHNVVAWQHLAEIVGACVRKCTKV